MTCSTRTPHTPTPAGLPRTHPGPRLRQASSFLHRRRSADAHTQKCRHRCGPTRPGPIPAATQPPHPMVDPSGGCEPLRRPSWGCGDPTGQAGGRGRQHWAGRPELIRFQPELFMGSAWGRGGRGNGPRAWALGGPSRPGTRGSWDQRKPLV